MLFHFGCDPDYDLADLRTRFGHVVLATGAWGRGVTPVESGGELVRDALDFLWDAQTPGGAAAGRRVAVIGAGDVAMDCARTALRTPGVEHVALVYRRTEPFMPAAQEDVNVVRAEGVEVLELMAPVSYDGSGPAVRAHRARRLPGPTAAARPAAPAPSSTFRSTPSSGRPGPRSTRAATAPTGSRSTTAGGRGSGRTSAPRSPGASTRCTSRATAGSVPTPSCGPSPTRRRWRGPSCAATACGPTSTVPPTPVFTAEDLLAGRRGRLAEPHDRGSRGGAVPALRRGLRDLHRGVPQPGERRRPGTRVRRRAADRAPRRPVQRVRRLRHVLPPRRPPLPRQGHRVLDPRGLRRLLERGLPPARGRATSSGCRPARSSPTAAGTPTSPTGSVASSPSSRPSTSGCSSRPSPRRRGWAG